MKQTMFSVRYINDKVEISTLKLQSGPSKHKYTYYVQPHKWDTVVLRENEIMQFINNRVVYENQHQIGDALRILYIHHKSCKKKSVALLFIKSIFRYLKFLVRGVFGR